MIVGTLQEQAEEPLNQYRAVGLVGPGQVGTTPLAKVIQSDLRERTVYLGIGLPSDYQGLPTLNYILAGSGTIPLLLLPLTLPSRRGARDHGYREARLRGIYTMIEGPSEFPFVAIPRLAN